MNLGQYVREIERLAGSIPVSFYGRMNGELISPANHCREGAIMTSLLNRRTTAGILSRLWS